MTRQLADRDHVGRFLQLDGLLVDKGTLVVHDRVRVERAILDFSCGRGAVRQPRAVSLATLGRTNKTEDRTYETHLRGS